MDKKGSFLALLLLDALEDENFKVAENLIRKLGSNPNIIIVDRGIAAIHYACGMENVGFAEKIVELMLQHGGNPNVRSEDNMTPLHVAAIWGRTNIAKMLLEKGGDINAVDDEKKTPILYAIYECQFEVIKLFQNFVFEKKISEKKNALLISANKIRLEDEVKSTSLSLKKLEARTFTPNKGHYNYGAASPYYISIAQGKKGESPKPKPKPIEKAADASKTPNKKENLFDLTEENLSQHSKNMSQDQSKISFIKTWRDKVQRSKNRRSLINKFNDIDSLLSGIMTDDSINFTNTILKLDGNEEEPERKPPQKFDMTGFGKLLQRLREEAKQQASDESFVTADNKFPDDSPKNESNFIRSPKPNEVVVQMFEEYVHTDDDNGLMFYEKRLLANRQQAELNKSHTSASTDFTVPLDYDSEALRAELTSFGDPPGPITKSTKRLYTKRLIKYQRNSEKVNNNMQMLENPEKCLNFSVELNRTVRSKEWFERITEYMELEAKVSFQFQGQRSSNKKWREGHLKTSFIYLLIDPRISDNLPGQSVFMDKQEVWRKFLCSIFYVGKGKSVRPYSHLYEAMKAFTKCNKIGRNETTQGESNKENQQVRNNRKEVYKLNSVELLKSPIKNVTDNKKLERILEIWQCGKGVVCLHVFHNILPAEAYTREAAIIDALSLQHLTNLKRGDYYGCSQTWNMRTRKCLGVALLYKALQIFLAEGESQLLPSDLI